MRFVLGVSAVAAVTLGLLWSHAYPWSPFVIATEAEHKLVINRFGEVSAVLSEPGLALRIPFFDTVRSYDRRLQYLNAEPVEIQIARSDKLIIDYYVLWAIRDPLAFLRSFPQGMAKAEDRLQEAVNGLVGARIGGLELEQLLERVDAIESIGEEMDREFAEAGLRVIDVRINRTELPRKAESAVYEQMREQRRALAREYRVKGERSAREVRAEAKRTARTLLAEAYAFSEVTRGEGDAVAARIYSDAYGRDPDFYDFVRSLEAYRKTLGRGTTLVVPPDHEFFRFLQLNPAR
jgi:membrane protease subunit HflC